MKDNTFSIAFQIRAKHGLLYEYLAENKLTGKMFATMVGVNEQSVYSWINLHSYPRDPQTLANIYRVTGIEPETLFPEGLKNTNFLKALKRATFIRDVSWNQLSAIAHKELPSYTIDEDIERIDLRNEMEKVLGRLSPREKEIIELRYGFNGPPATFDEIGEKLGLTDKRIRQIEATALRRMRNPTRRKTLEQFL